MVKICKFKFFDLTNFKTIEKVEICSGSCKWKVKVANSSHF